MNNPQRIEAMNIQIANVADENNKLVFNIHNVDTCVVNAIRRTTLSSIDSLVFKGFPYEENNIRIIKNHTNFNNEYMKQRISCIPIMNDDVATFNSFRENYKVVLDETNTGQGNMNVTTEHIKIVNKTTNEIWERKDVVKYFPPDSYTKDYILLCVLFPNQGGLETQNESFHFEADFEIGTAKENACWNVVDNCTYEFIQNHAEVEKKKKTFANDSDKRDFELLDAQRIYHPNEYKMTFETLGIYTNRQIVLKSCDYILSKLILMMQFLKEQSQTTILQKDDVKANAVDGTATNDDRDKLKHMYCDLYREDDFYIFELKDDDYTMGKLIENYFYKFNKDKLNFVGFKKEHPTQLNAFIYFKYKSKYETKEMNSDRVIQPMIESIAVINDIFKEIKAQLMIN